MAAVDKFPHNFFISCAGYDKKILRELPDSETVKHSKTGVLLLFTGLFAAFGGGYFYFLIFKNQPLAILLGVVWGLFFFVLDRAIVSDTKVSLVPENNTLVPLQERQFSILKFLRNFIPIVIRVMVALVSATIVSKSIELRIFKNSIERRITQERIDDNKRHDNLIFGYQEKAKTEIGTEKSKLDKYNSDPQEAIELKQSFERCDDEYDKLDLETENELRVISNNLDAVKRKWALVEDAYKDPEYIRNRTRREEIQGRLKAKKRECDKIQDKIDEILKGWKEEGKNEKKKVEQREAEINEDLKDRENNANRLRDEEVHRDTLDELLPRQYLALDTIQEKEPPLGQLGRWLFLLFLGIELSPILRKLLMPKSMYDYKLESQENMLIVDLKSEEELLKSKVENSKRIYNETLSKAEIEEVRMKIKKEIDYKQGITHVKDALENFHIDLTKIDKEFYNSKIERIKELQKAIKEKDEKLIEYLKSTIISYDDLQLQSKNQLFENFKKSFLK